MELTSNEVGGDVVVSVRDDRIDAAVAVTFKDSMRDYFSGPYQRVILDLSNVEFIDSSGLGAIVAILKEVTEGKSLALAALTPGVEKVLRLTRMDTVFKIYSDVDSAFEGIAHAS